MSPHLFNLCAYIFLGFIYRAHKKGEIHGIKIALGAPSTSNIFFGKQQLMLFVSRIFFMCTKTPLANRSTYTSMRSVSTKIFLLEKQTDFQI